MTPALFNHALQETLDLIGIFVFTISGALLAVRKDFDIVGMLVLAAITALGSGVYARRPVNYRGKPHLAHGRLVGD